MILLDTHTWIWWSTSSGKLSSRAKRTIERSEKIGVHTISCWEITMLVKKGRLKFDREVEDWILIALTLSKVKAISLTAKIAIQAAQLESFHGDPADRFLAATSLVMGIPLVSKDEQILNWGQIEVIW